MRRTFKFDLAAPAAAVFVAALALAGLGVPEYAHRLHPLALRGAGGLPGAWAFNAGAFVLPGGLLALQALRWRARRARPGWALRLALALALLSALAFAAQGLVPLDMRSVDAPANRLHALAWMLWWIAFVPAAAAFAWAVRAARAPAVAGLLLAAAVPLLAVLLPIGAWVGLAQRFAFLAWFGWWLLAGRALSRSAA